MPEHADTISIVWLQAFRTATDSATQLALLYVLNEIILKCAGYGSPEVKNSFKDSVIDALKCLRPGLLIKKVKKLLLVWIESGLFDKKFNHQLSRIANTIDPRQTGKNIFQTENDEASLIKDFAPDKFVNQLRVFKRLDESILTYAESDLIPSCFSLPIDTIVRRMKSKDEGISFARQVKTCASQLDEALENMDKTLSAQENIIKNIDKATMFYSVQQKEALVVANAYKSYEEQVRNTLSTVRRNLGIEDDASPAAVEMTTDDEGETANGAPNNTTTSTPPKLFDGTDDDDDDAVEMEAVVGDDEEEPPDPFGIRGIRFAEPPASEAIVDVTSLLVDLNSLKDYPFCDEIVVDARGDVDYRPMFEKMKASDKASVAQVASVEGASDAIIADGNAPKVSGSPRVKEMGDFDYRHKPGSTEAKKAVDPFGLGDDAKDADLRFAQQQQPQVPVVDLDYRNVPTQPQQWLPSVLPTPANTLSCDSDLRQHQAVAAAAMYNAALVNMVTRAQTAVTTSFLYSTPPLLPTIGPSMGTRPPPPPAPPIALPPPTQQQPPPTAASAALPNISEDILSTLKLINLSNMRQPERVPVASEGVSEDQKEEVKNDAGRGEDPFAIISRLTGLSNLMQSVRPQPTKQPITIPISSATQLSATSVEQHQQPKQTPIYSDDSSNEEGMTGDRPLSSSPSPIDSYSPGLKMVDEGDEEEDDQEDGEATPTQDEDHTPPSKSAGLTGLPGPFTYQPSALGCVGHSQPNLFPTGMSIKPSLLPPPPGLGTAMPANLLAFPFPHVNTQPTFNPLHVATNMGQPAVYIPMMQQQSAAWQSVPSNGRPPTTIPQQVFFQNVFGGALSK